MGDAPTEARDLQKSRWSPMRLMKVIPLNTPLVLAGALSWTLGEDTASDVSSAYPLPRTGQKCPFFSQNLRQIASIPSIESSLVIKIFR
jgi:hypothetical protein